MALHIPYGVTAHDSTEALVCCHMAELFHTAGGVSISTTTLEHSLASFMKAKDTNVGPSNFTPAVSNRVIWKCAPREKYNIHCNIHCSNICYSPN